MQFSTRAMDGNSGVKSRRARYRVAIGQRRWTGGCRAYAAFALHLYGGAAELGKSRRRCLGMLREIELFQTAADCHQLSVQVSMVAWRMLPGPERRRVEGYCRRLELHAADLENEATELADS
jgi:hypothetical protein